MGLIMLIENTTEIASKSPTSAGTWILNCKTFLGVLYLAVFKVPKILGHLKYRSVNQDQLFKLFMLKYPYARRNLPLEQQ